MAWSQQGKGGIDKGEGGYWGYGEVIGSLMFFEN